ncbi:MAG: hypothetical protein IH991_21965, partial [Planctomycetes bacterium]|nr:hypothetical protein [Planctomycetota bacterium]
MATRRRTQPRRGLVLLIVLSLLTLFMLMGVTFLISSRQYVKGARARAKHEVTGVNPRKHLDVALYQLLRDTRMVSPISGHSLLGDLYGYADEPVKGQVLSVTADSNLPSTPPQPPTQPPIYNTGGQFYLITFASPGGYSTSTNYYSGRVITFFDYDQSVSVNQRPAGPISTRIVASGSGWVRIEWFAANQTFNTNALVGSTFFINDQAFNGTGAGFDGNNLNLLALLPNFSAYTTAAEANVGGADESYDAVDYQNMFLAMVPPSASSSQDIIPSFHRPALANYWANHALGVWDVNDYRAFRRRVLFRPMPWDHPNFSGSNPALAGGTWVPGPDNGWGVANFDDDGVNGADDVGEAGWPGSDDHLNNDLALLSTLLNGPWDVDNDNDNITDSIWMDIGLPTFTAKNGRIVKPLVAILVKDMDGRLNVNAHSSYAQLTANYTSNLTGLATMPVVLPRGRGFGPAEV